MKKEFNVFFGFEIEGCFNQDFIINTLKIGYIPPYHEPRTFNEYWKYEKDGSLQRSVKFKNECLIEFTTKKLKNRNEFFKALTNFRVKIFKNKPLNEVIDFNNSMGCHIHISTDKKNLFSNLLSLEDYKRTREYFFNKINASLILSKETKTAVLKQYEREHSELLNKRNIRDNERYKEFNNTSETIDKAGIEWRGFNLCGVKNWGEFNELFLIAYSTIEFLLKRRFGKKKKANREFFKLKDFIEEYEIKNENEVIYLEEDDLLIINKNNQINLQIEDNQIY